MVHGNKEFASVERKAEREPWRDESNTLIIRS